MSLLDRVSDLLQSLATTELQLKNQHEMLSEFRRQLGLLREDMQRLSHENQQIRERLTRLETMREADRAQMAAEIARFQTEVERARLQLNALPPSQGET